MLSRCKSEQQSVAEPEPGSATDVEEAPSGDTLFSEVAHLDAKQLLAGAASTLASLAYAKLESGDLAQAKLAIDGVAALVPLLEGHLRSDLAQALAGLQVAYADIARGTSADPR
jgi:hypothetical protein